VLASPAWLKARRGQSAQTEATLTPTDEQLRRERDADTVSALAGMRAIGGAEVVAYCFDLASREDAPLALRRAALEVLAQHVDRRDAAAQARGAALWDRVSALSEPGAPTAAPACKADCDPPYWLDERGIKKFKPSCL